MPKSTTPKTVRASHISIAQLMQPEHANILGNVHGGWIMKLIDEAGALACMRHSQRRVVTVAMDSIVFRHPIRVGDLILLDAQLTAVGRTSMEVEIQVQAENPISGQRWHTNTAYAVYVALDNAGKPIRVLPLIAETEEEKRRAGGGSRAPDASSQRSSMTRLPGVLRNPILALLAVALAAALFVFQDYGLTWDEPLFYGYADAIGYAYTPANWFSGHFDLSQSYGPSPDDHKTRGPGYLLLARLPAQALQALGMSTASSWHLINALGFLLGVYFVFRLCLWFASEAAAAAAAALFCFQPLLWGHAFINPKDMPFMVLFCGSIWLGVRMVEHDARHGSGGWRCCLGEIALPAALLGLATSNRVLGPLAGLLVGAYWLTRRPGWRTARWILAYGLLAAAIAFATWPYLWETPRNFVEVFGLMAQNPTVLPVLFADTVYRANDLPLRYLPFFLATTLTEPVWPVFALGIGSIALAHTKTPARLGQLSILLGWLVIPIGYVLVARPPMYDGMRHFLFVLPPVFAIGAAGSTRSSTRLTPSWTRIVLVALILAPGLFAIVRLHPYEYTYFNSLVGGTTGVFRHYETDYWLTCYKELVERLNQQASGPARLFVHREASVAAPYAGPNLTVLEQRGAISDIRSGDYVLVSTRTNEDLRAFRDDPSILAVGRAGATFCLIKRVP